MNRKTKLWLIMGASLILIGCIIFAGVMTMLNFDFRKLSTSKYETNTYTITDKFSNILINTNTADITFALSDDDICKVESFEEKNIKHLVEVKDSTLTINVVDERKWFNYIGFDFYSPKLTVYLPKSEYKSLVIENSTGDILIPKDFKFDSEAFERIKMIEKLPPTSSKVQILCAGIASSCFGYMLSAGIPECVFSF